ncbi:MAG: ribonuclease P protein component [Draconibacterium sp.]|nr:ribonuclease P protein component [Draconibacterium sp.]
MANYSENSIDSKRRFTFKKEERLTSKKVIDKLFSEGDSFLAFPLKVVFFETPLSSKYPVQVAFSVGKRNFKLAVHRNKIKRKMREAYRLKKFQLYDILDDKQVAVFFLFIGKEIPDYKLVNSAMEKAIKKMITEISSDK